MLVTPVISQLDPRWKDKKLGTSKTNTIGYFGCIITCLTALAGKTDVGDTNQKMIDNGAFVDDDLVYWVRVPFALTNLKFVWRSWTYDNNKVKDWIYNHGFPVIVQVDAAPIGAPRSDHYILYLGDQKCLDPWTGKIRPTSDFPDVKGYILYEVTQPSKAEKVKAIILDGDDINKKVTDILSLFQ